MTRPTAMRQRALWACLAATVGLSVWTAQRPDESASAPVVRPPAAKVVAATSPPPAPAPARAYAEGAAPAAQGADAASPPAPLADPVANAVVGPVVGPIVDPLADPFAVTQWTPPPPPAPPAPPPPPPPAPVAPSAPPLPFRYVGRQEPAEGPASATEYYLAREREAIAVRAGASIGADYRFDGEASRGVLRFVYLPLGTEQTLFIGEEK